LDTYGIWINLVCLLLSTASTRILVNGTPGEIFHHRGTRQVDPLSLMLLTLVMQVFHSLIDIAAHLGLLADLPVSRGSLYADNVMIIHQPTQQDCETILELLWLFGEATGLHTNILKSTAIPIQCSDQERQLIAQNLHCRVKDFPIIYLEVPLSIWKLCSEDLQPLIDKLYDELYGWRAGLQSKG
jgi:hypothetical protein